MGCTIHALWWMFHLVCSQKNDPSDRLLLYCKIAVHKMWDRLSNVQGLFYLLYSSLLNWNHGPKRSHGTVGRTKFFGDSRPYDFPKIWAKTSLGSIRAAYIRLYDAQLWRVVGQVKFFLNDLKSRGHLDLDPIFSKIIETETSKNFRTPYLGEHRRIQLFGWQISYDDTVGRHVKATRNIEAGEVLNIEEAIASHLSPFKMKSNCVHCFRRFKASVLPSPINR